MGVNWFTGGLWVVREPTVIPTMPGLVRAGLVPPPPATLPLTQSFLGPPFLRCLSMPSPDKLDPMSFVCSPRHL